MFSRNGKIHSVNYLVDLLKLYTWVNYYSVWVLIKEQELGVVAWQQVLNHS